MTLGSKLLMAGALTAAAVACGGPEDIEGRAEVRAMGFAEDVEVVHYEWDRYTDQQGLPNGVDDEDIRNVTSMQVETCGISNTPNWYGDSDLNCTFASECFWMDEDQYCRTETDILWSYGLRRIVIDRECEVTDPRLSELRPEEPERNEDCINALPLADGQRFRRTQHFLMRVLGSYDADRSDEEDIQDVQAVVEVDQTIYTNVEPGTEVGIKVDNSGTVREVFLLAS